MNKFWIMLSHTYLNRVKTKSFLIVTLVTLALIFALTNLQTIIDTFSGDEETTRVAVVSEEEDITASLQQQVANIGQGDMELESFEGSLQEAQQAVEAEEYDAVVDISLNDSGLPTATFYADQVASTTTSDPIRQGLQQVKVAMATEQAGVDQETVQEVFAPVTFSKEALEESAKTAEELDQARGLVYIMLFFMYFAVMMYGSMISTEVATEKSSRVMEILISSVSPVSQMFAKIGGIALLGLTQFGLFLLAGYLSLQVGETSGQNGALELFNIQGGETATIVYAVIFFLLGYLLYATLAATLGSLVSRLEDAQQVVAPMMMLIIASFLIAMFGLGMPDSPFIVVTSFIPFFTPLLMFLRVGMLEIPFWEVALSIGLLVATIIGLAILGARVYRGGVLMYGKSSSLKDIKQALLLSKKEN
ncbi:ABC transporter permease [Thalassobacillus sp. CUG 92003]|uniref:ABC transporter permease n=1 Tax=Thalassobacillus sp. CUG 92003 TaxID=2736641 RepID=UPI0015E7AD28|nr:ABC transporter permease [Thalassobacillus sp. CUG 92003]